MHESISNNDINISSSDPFPIVGVGASAGGLEAFKRLIRAIPEFSGMAFILVQHLEPHHESLLVEILQKSTPIPVEEITDKVHVEPDHIYIIPSNKLVTAGDGRLHLSSRPPQNEKNMPIDLFFTSLAEVYQARAIGVVLSGTATDGTQGLKDIRDQGGVTFAQEQGSAAFRGMPQSAIDAGVVDFILVPEEIPAQIAKLAKAFGNGEPDADTPEAGTEDAYRQLLTLLRLKKGTDFTYYKQTTIRRRIARRMALTKNTTLTAYLAFFREQPAEQDLLYQDLLIPVTGFFRDPTAYDVISRSLLPLLFREIEPDAPLRIWIAGCSTGQETYSMAICLHEYLGDRINDHMVQIFSTDVSEKAIATARKGVYSKTEIAGLSPQRLEKYFEKVNGSFRVAKFIRDLCVFATHNFLNSPPFARMHLISCRNVLIYMEPFLQKKALSTFHYSLRENGYLLLGRSETTSPAPDLFLPFDRKEKVYTRKASVAKFLPLSVARPELETEAPGNIIRKEPGRDDFQRSADNMLLSRFSPPGVVVNQQGEIVQFRGSTSSWMEPGPGKPSLNVLKMTKDGLSFELRNALHKARTENKPQVRADIPMPAGSEQQRITIEVHPLPNTTEPYFLILFRATGSAMPQVGGQATTAMAGDEAGNDLHLRNQQLEKELAALREDMRCIMEDQEAVIEELQSANEELLSGSEELQSLNEELETSKEEIQSTNEELTTLNLELFDRNEQLNLARLFAESIVATIREPLLILDRNMQVRTANKSFYEKFNVHEEETEGRSLYMLGAGEWDIPALRTALGTLLSREERITDIEINFPIQGAGERILLVNASRIFRKDNSEQLILLAVEDVSEVRSREDQQRRFADELAKQVEERTASLKEANAALKYSNENLEQFATIASHDLQEPLRKIRTFAAILEKRHSNELQGEALELLQKIAQSAVRMASLIYDVLNFSKILDASVFERTDLNVALQIALRDYDLQIEQKAAIVRYDPLPIITAVPLQMNQLFANLLSNALKFFQPGVAPVVDITFRPIPAPELKAFPRLDQHGSYGEIIFADQGIGIDPVFAERVFLIFQRLNAGEHFDGTGVGLALCKRIVSNHRGEIFVDSNAGAGARFHIILPLV